MVALSKPVKVGDTKADTVEFRPLTAGDVIAAREAAEKIFFVQTADGAVAYPGQSNTRLSVELLRRQVRIGGVSPVPPHVIEGLSAADLTSLEEGAGAAEKKSTPPAPSDTERPASPLPSLT